MKAQETIPDFIFPGTLHSLEMKYPKEIDGILKKYMAVIRKMYADNEIPFNREYNERQFQQYLEMLSKQ